MTRKRTDKEVVVSPATGAAPSRRKPARAHVKHTAVPAEAPASEPAEIALQTRAVTAPEPTHGEIAALAYCYWEARGCQGGSPEEDWLRAELELRSSAATM